MILPVRIVPCETTSKLDSLDARDDLDSASGVMGLSGFAIGATFFASFLAILRASLASRPAFRTFSCTARSHATFCSFFVIPANIASLSLAFLLDLLLFPSPQRPGRPQAGGGGFDPISVLVSCFAELADAIPRAAERERLEMAEMSEYDESEAAEEVEGGEDGSSDLICMMKSSGEDDV